MTAPIESLYEKPIPALDSVREEKKGYRRWRIDLHDERAAEAVRDGRDVLQGVNHYYRTDNPPYLQRIADSIPQLFLRETVLQKLQEVDARLRPSGLELFLFDAWRPAKVQFAMRNEWFAPRVRAQHPEWTEEQVEREIAQYWASAFRSEAEINPLSPPPHSTGGAVDLTIRPIDGEPVSMGTMFDELATASYTDALETSRDEEGRRNRRLLYWLMRDAGFTNNPTEWWHFSYGDQMWAKLSSAEEGKEIPAFYSSINPLD